MIEAADYADFRFETDPLLQQDKQLLAQHEEDEEKQVENKMLTHFKTLFKTCELIRGDDFYFRLNKKYGNDKAPYFKCKGPK